MTLRRLAGVSTLLPAALWPLYGHLAALTVAAGCATRRRRRTPEPATAPLTRFTVLVPAHDEERLIADTVTSLTTTGYPDELLSVHVVADHCNDATATIARRLGVQVHEHVDPEPAGKGAALRWGLPRAVPPTVGTNDAVVLVDADSVVEPGFFHALDRCFGAGATVVQARYAVRPGRDEPVVDLRSAAIDLRHLVRALGRNALGGSCGLYGNGMAFRPDVLRRRSWTDHLTEDLELQTELLLDGTVVRFEPDAVVRAEMPTSLDRSRTQHERWERGRLDLARRYVPVLLTKAVSARGARRRALLDGAADHLVPPLSVLAGAAVATTAWAVAAATLLPSRASRLGTWNAAAIDAALAFHVLAGLRIARVPRSVYASMTRAPALVVWKTSLWLGMFGATDVQWVRTDRGADPRTGPRRGRRGRAGRTAA